MNATETVNELRRIELVRTLDRLKACADGPQTRVCLTSKECLEVCAYIYWLTAELAKAREKGGRDELG